MIICHPRHPNHLSQDLNSILWTFLEQFAVVFLFLLCSSSPLWIEYSSFLLFPYPSFPSALLPATKIRTSFGDLHCLLGLLFSCVFFYSKSATYFHTYKTQWSFLSLVQNSTEDWKHSVPNGWFQAVYLGLPSLLPATWTRQRSRRSRLTPQRIRITEGWRNSFKGSVVGSLS